MRLSALEKAEKLCGFVFHTYKCNIWFCSTPDSRWDWEDIYRHFFRFCFMILKMELWKKFIEICWWPKMSLNCNCLNWYCCVFAWLWFYIRPLVSNRHRFFYSPIPACPTIQDIRMKSITPQIFSMQRTWRKIDGIKTGLWQVYLATLKLTRTPLTQPNLMVPPLASFAAKAAASSAADGSSPLARPSSNSSCQPVAAIMEEKAPTGEQ